MNKGIAFMGDSITDFCCNRKCERYSGSGYATIVKAKLGCEYPEQFSFFNCGYSGAQRGFLRKHQTLSH